MKLVSEMTPVSVSRRSKRAVMQVGPKKGTIKFSEKLC